MDAIHHAQLADRSLTHQFAGLLANHRPYTNVDHTAVMKLARVGKDHIEDYKFTQIKTLFGPHRQQTQHPMRFDPAHMHDKSRVAPRGFLPLGDGDHFVRGPEYNSSTPK